MSKFTTKGLAETVLLRPHTTEKSVMGETLAKPTYTFVVDKRATKREVAMAVKKLYQVEPLKIHIVNSKAKRFLYRGRPGQTTGFKKAIIFLPTGTKLKLI